jgi:excisionase family DNA binding protein
MSAIPAQPPSHRSEPPPEAGRSQRPPLSTSEAAARIGVHERTLRRYLSRGLLAHRLPGGHYRISEESILSFWLENERRAPHIRRSDADAEPVPASRQSHRLTFARSRSPRQRRLGETSSMCSYDL